MFVLVFGSLTLYFQDDLFIKLKPTIVNVCLASTLFVGLAFGHSLLRIPFRHAFSLDDAGWRKLTIRWAVFFLFMAALNEVVRRTTSTSTWLNFKVFGVMPITMGFALSQLGVVKEHSIERPDATPDGNS